MRAQFTFGSRMWRLWSVTQRRISIGECTGVTEDINLEGDIGVLADVGVETVVSGCRRGMMLLDSQFPWITRTIKLLKAKVEFEGLEINARAFETQARRLSYYENTLRGISPVRR